MCVFFASKPSVLCTRLELRLLCRNLLIMWIFFLNVYVVPDIVDRGVVTATPNLDAALTAIKGTRSPIDD
jgi:hypothetical protein